MSFHQAVKPPQLETAVDELVALLEADGMATYIGDGGIYARDWPEGDQPDGNDWVQILAFRPTRPMDIVGNHRARQVVIISRVETPRAARGDVPQIRVEQVARRIVELVTDTGGFYLLSGPSNAMWDDDRSVYFNNTLFGVIKDG